MMWSGRHSLDEMEAWAKRDMAKRSVQVYDGDGDSERSRILELMQTETNEEVLQDLTRRLWHNLKMGPPPPEPEPVLPPKPINPTMWAWYWLLFFAVMQGGEITKASLREESLGIWIITGIVGLCIGGYFLVVFKKLNRFTRQTAAYEDYKKEVESWKDQD